MFFLFQYSFDGDGIDRKIGNVEVYYGSTLIDTVNDISGESMIYARPFILHRILLWKFQSLPSIVIKSI